MTNTSENEVRLARLEAAGKALYGDDWKSPTARAAGVSLRQLWNYIEHKAPVPDRVDQVLPDILADSAAKHRDTADKLEKLAAAM